jgi:hypothetical protein
MFKSPSSSKTSSTLSTFRSTRQQAKGSSRLLEQWFSAVCPLVSPLFRFSLSAVLTEYLLLSFPSFSCPPSFLFTSHRRTCPHLCLPLLGTSQCRLRLRGTRCDPKSRPKRLHAPPQPRHRLPLDETDGRVDKGYRSRNEVSREPFASIFSDDGVLRSARLVLTRFRSQGYLLPPFFRRLPRRPYST